MEVITSVKNAYILKLLTLKDKKNQFLNQQYLIEGLNIVNEALKNNVVDTILTTKKHFKSFDFKNIIEISDNVAKKLSDLKTSQEIFAVCNIKNNPITNSNYLILDDIQDPGNLGTLLRSALAFNFKNILCSFNCVSVYNPKVLRAAQGNHFKLNIEYCDLEKKINLLKNQKLKIISTSLNQTSNFNLDKLDEQQNYGLILGNEGSGVKQQLTLLSDYNLLLDINSEVDSLNVGVAGSILMYKLFNKN
ncbi:RNA methyltransferase, TrmH family [Spiroplasma gladiatoris]|uniref:RNA methyltransferase, TrmH family n=1 Tax=Spiroplasma gladiatoris TaxID=2143 RepID=A0A4P7AJI6_9MOLU|nr:RNA methyltransferase [Spiroplasma gladiatoris]QBQ07968.1 RNA methyltransferase, TrmH family [Spiroplasma gladiatoris]